MPLCWGSINPRIFAPPVSYQVGPMRMNRSEGHGGWLMLAVAGPMSAPGIGDVVITRPTILDARRAPGFFMVIPVWRITRS